MPALERLSAQERRAEILAVSLGLFARHGQHGVTTRQIAEAAGVSEALLYRHFRSKDELYSELQRACLSSMTRVAERMVALEASTATLVMAIFYMANQILRACELGARQSDLRRLMLNSLAGDGDFARGFLEANVGRYMPKLVECLGAAHRAGDLMTPVEPAALRLWFCHHLMATIGNIHLPQPPAVDHGVDTDTLIDEAVRFALRGLGLRPEAIARHFQPRTLALLIEGLEGT